MSMRLGGKKQCSRCCEFKWANEFNVSTKEAGQLAASCKACVSIINKKQYKALLKNRDHIKKQAESRKNNKWIAVEKKGGRCVGCGFNECVTVLDFHHLIDKNKVPPFNWLGSLKTNMKEAQKCVILCCRCHQLITHGYKVKYQEVFEFESKKTLAAYRIRKRIKFLKKETLRQERMHGYAIGQLCRGAEKLIAKQFTVEELDEEVDHDVCAIKCERKIKYLRKKLKKVLAQKFIPNADGEDF